MSWIIQLVISFYIVQFFGFMAMIVYGVDAFFKFKAWRAGEVS